jgi:hypothetical protein
MCPAIRTLIPIACCRSLSLADNSLQRHFSSAAVPLFSFCRSTKNPLHFCGVEESGMRKSPTERTRVVGTRWHDLASIGTAVIEPASALDVTLSDSGANRGPRPRRVHCAAYRIQKSSITVTRTSTG